MLIETNKWKRRTYRWCRTYRRVQRISKGVAERSNLLLTKHPKIHHSTRQGDLKIMCGANDFRCRWWWETRLLNRASPRVWDLLRTDLKIAGVWEIVYRENIFNHEKNSKNKINSLMAGVYLCRSQEEKTLSYFINFLWGWD